MATELEAFEFKGNGTYPWKLWMNGKIWEAVYRKDFSTAPVTFINTVKAAASRHKVHVNAEVLTTDGHVDNVVFQFYK